MAFGEDILLFRVEGRIFVCLSITAPAAVALKADPVRAIELRERYEAIEPAWHWNKKYWIQFAVGAPLPTDLVQTIIRQSYGEVVKKLPKSVKIEFPEILSVYE